MGVERILTELVGATTDERGSGDILACRGAPFLGKQASVLGGAGAIRRLASAAWTRAGCTPSEQPAEASAGGFCEIPPAARGNRRRIARNHDRVRALRMLRAMIAAAHAAGRYEPDEVESIRAQVDGLELGEFDRRHLWSQLSSPLDVDSVVAGATSSEAAAETYAASLLVLDDDAEAERAVLARLADGLGLPAGVVEEMHAELGRPVPQGAPSWPLLDETPRVAAGGS